MLFSTVQSSYRNSYNTITVENNKTESEHTCERVLIKTNVIKAIWQELG